METRFARTDEPGDTRRLPNPRKTVWVVIEVDDVSNATVDRQIARSPNIAVSLAWRRPTKQIVRHKIAAAIVENAHDAHRCLAQLNVARQTYWRR